MGTAEDRTELITKLKALCLKRFGDEDAWPQLFDAYDRDHNGQADRDEVEAMLADADVGRVFSRSHWATGIFLAVDRDENGTISRAELEQAMRAMSPPKPKTARTLSDDEARAIALIVLTNGASKANLGNFSPADLAAIGAAKKELAPNLGVVAVAPKAPNSPAPIIDVTGPTRKPAPASTVGEQIGIALLVGLVLMAVGDRRRR